MFITSLKNELNKYHLLQHSFYKKWSDGKLSLNDLQEYAKQYYHHEEAFTRALSRTHSQCKQVAARQVLLGNLMDEEQGQENHQELWLKFAEELGVERNDVKTVALNPETKALVDGFFAICDKGYPHGLGALYAYEQQIPEVAKSKIDGLKKFYNIDSEKALKFFQVHIKADEWHSAECEALLNQLTTEEQSQAAEGAVQAGKLLWQFLDGVDKHVAGHSCASPKQMHA